MPPQVTWPGYEGFLAGLTSTTQLDAAPLMQRWCDIIVEGNRRGVLKGVDGFNQPMTPLKYRNGAGKRTSNRRVPDYGTTLHESSGTGPFATGLHDNLAGWQYRQLTGPRLAPRREASRVIKNLHTRIDHNPSTGEWFALGAWYEVVSQKQVPFLPFHFNGMGRNPRYDLRPVRPEDRQFCLNALTAFMSEHFRKSF
jgi:hypothetical protein